MSENKSTMDDLAKKVIELQKENKDNTSVLCDVLDCDRDDLPALLHLKKYAESLSDTVNGELGIDTAIEEIIADGDEVTYETLFFKLREQTITELIRDADVYFADYVTIRPIHEGGGVKFTSDERAAELKSISPDAYRKIKAYIDYSI